MGSGVSCTMEEQGRMNADQAMPEALRVMGTRVVPFESYTQAVDCIGAAIAARKKTFCVAINPEKVYRAQRDPTLHAMLEQAEVAICDGVGVALGARLLHGRHVPRCTGVDLCLELLKAAGQRGWRVFLLGASPEANEEAAHKLTERFPGLEIAGRQHGYFKDGDAIVEQINASGADLLFVAMGSPRQERWITKHRAAIDAPFCMGIGGTLDVISGTVKRAPRVCRRTGTEFLYRLLCQPQRIRRQIALPLFALEVLKQAWRGRAVAGGV